MEVAELYVKLRSVRKVAKALNVTEATVAKLLKTKCSYLTSHKGALRLHILMRGKCFMSANEAREHLKTSRQNVIYLFKLLTSLTPEYKVVSVRKQVWKYRKIPLTYIVRNNSKCINLFLKYISELTNEEVIRLIVWR